jgi:radical SAM superfamily enzyme YgiQ (UPF0313 family)
MKALFVNPYIVDFSAYDLWLRPLGLCYLAAAVRQYSDAEIYWLDALDRFQEGLEIHGRADGRGKYQREFVEKPRIYQNVPRNYSRYGIPLELFLKKIAALPEIDVILITSLMTYWVEGLQFTLQLLKKRFPRAKVILGGVLPTLALAAAKKLSLADVYVQGHGEGAILQILCDLGANVSPHPDFSSIANLPLPAVDLAGSQKYVPLLTSRGCPQHCSYCASGLLNPVFQERQKEKILAEIFRHQQEFNTEHFIIFDDALLINKKKRFQAVFSRLAQELPPQIQFHAPNGLHTREIDKKTAAILYAARFKTLRLSFESLAPKILRQSDNKVKREQMEKAVGSLEKAGYRRSQLEVYLLFGYPGQTMSDMEKTLAFVGKMGLVPHLALFSPVPGTVDFKWLQQQGVLTTPVNLLETNKLYFLYEKSGFSAAEIIHVKKIATEIAAASLKQ